MPHLILSDIHANLEALEAVMADAHGLYHKVLCLGDLVGYGPDPNAAVEWARASADAIVRGNHDKACSGNDPLEYYRPAARVAALWTRDALSDENARYLEQLPRGPLRYENFDLVHGSPVDEDEYLTSIAEVAPLRPCLAAQATFFGHTHVQGGFFLARGGVKRIVPDRSLDLEPDHLYLLNPGSVGQPRDGDPRAGYALYWPTERVIEYRRVTYDVRKTSTKILACGLPEAVSKALAARLFQGT